MYIVHLSIMEHRSNTKEWVGWEQCRMLRLNQDNKHLSSSEY